MLCRREVALRHCAAQRPTQSVKCRIWSSQVTGTVRGCFMDPKYIPWQDLRSYFSFRRTAWIQPLHPIENILPGGHASMAPTQMLGGITQVSQRFLWDQVLAISTKYPGGTCHSCPRSTSLPNLPSASWRRQAFRSILVSGMMACLPVEILSFGGVECQ